MMKALLFNSKVIAINRFSDNVIEYAENQLRAVADLKDCALNVLELQDLFLAAQKEADYISPDRLVKEIKRWTYDLGMPKAFFNFLRTEESSTLNYEQLAKLIVKSIMTDHQHDDFKIEFEMENKKFYIAESGSPRAQIYERRIWEQISRSSKPYAPYVRASMHESKNPFIVKGEKIKVYILSAQASKKDERFKEVLLNLADKLKKVYSNFSTEMRSIFSLMHIMFVLNSFVPSFAKPVLTQENTPKILEKHLRQWLVGSTKPEIQIIEEENNRTTMTFSPGIHLNTEHVFKIINQFPHTVERFYLNRIGKGKNTQFIFTLYFNDSISSQTREAILHKIKQSTIVSHDDLFASFENAIPDQEISLLQAISMNLSQFLADRHSGFEVIKAGSPEEYRHKKRKAIVKTTGDLKRSAFSLEDIQKAFIKNPHSTKMLIQFFHKKFKNSDIEVNANDILKNIREESQRRVFQGAINTINAVKITNFYESDRESVVFLRDPNIAFENLGYEPEIVPSNLIVMNDDLFHFYRVGYGKGIVDRGGVRIKIARSAEQERLFKQQALAECVDLAYTQNLKNKDINQAGAKGVMVVRFGADPDRALKRFAKAIIQLAMQSEPHMPIELGPDENFKDEYTIYITQLAKKMGYKYANTIMSGKPDILGGIGHKFYGVTTHGIKAAQDAYIEEKNLDPKKMTKAMSGGVQGDLAGNEIKKSQIENVVLNMDESAIVYDPHIINREEHLRLVNDGKKKLQDFDEKQLSEDGFKIKINDFPQTHKINGKEITLTGREWAEKILGMIQADVFVPCGGARNTITRDNWKKLLLTEDGKPRYKAIFEGANVYIEEDVYVEIERAGITVYRDLSANKGGVITSDNEISAGYIFNLSEFERLMCFEDKNNKKSKNKAFDLLNIFETKNKTEPLFKKNFTQNVLDIVYARGRQEYATVRRLSDNSNGRITNTEASELLANSINETSSKILKHYKTFIKANAELEKICVKWYLPNIIFTEKTIEQVMKSLPYEEKIKPIVATVLASQYHYKNGVRLESDLDLLDFAQEVSANLPNLDSIINTPIQELINR